MKRAWAVMAALLVLILVSTGVVVRWRAQQALNSAGDAIRSESEIRFTIAPLSSTPDRRFEWVGSPASFRSAAVFHGHLFIASTSGLFEYDDHGQPLRDLRVGRELPPSPLQQLVVGVVAGSREPELIVATEHEGILFYDGTQFRQLLPADRDAKSVTAVLPLGTGQLLIATPKRGVLVFDGTHIRSFHKTLDAINVTALAGDEADLWVGTLDRGVIHWHAGQAETFTDTDGLPDRAVHSLALDGQRAYVGTSTGIAEFKDGRLERTFGNGLFARALQVSRGKLLVGTIDEGLRTLPLTVASQRGGNVTRVADPIDGVEEFLASGGVTYAVAERGVYRRESASAGWKRVLEPESSLLADRNISAVALNDSGDLWVGYFDRGLDLVEHNGRRKHMEDDHLFCVNRIVVDGRQREVDVATANGLVVFDAAGNKAHVVGTGDGLISEHVTDVALRDGGKVVATPSGLTFIDASGARSLYVLHGLVNNHVYALGSTGRQVLAGTLGGVSILEDDQIRANLTTANSGLKHNWVTAAVAAGPDWFVGTYGAGVMRITAKGEVEALDVATAPTEVNPNALIATPGFVLAGTLGNGLYVFDRASQRWTILTSGLPSLNVTALAEHGDQIYIGTDNGLVRIAKSALR